MLATGKIQGICGGGFCGFCVESVLAMDIHVAPLASASSLIHSSQ